MRVPFEIIVEEANRIILRMASSTSHDDIDYYWKMYLGYIEACGWSNQQLDQELLSRIDNSWDIKKFTIN